MLLKHKQGKLFSLLYYHQLIKISFWQRPLHCSNQLNMMNQEESIPHLFHTNEYVLKSFVYISISLHEWIISIGLLLYEWIIWQAYLVHIDCIKQVSGLVCLAKY